MVAGQPVRVQSPAKQMLEWMDPDGGRRASVVGATENTACGSVTTRARSSRAALASGKTAFKSDSISWIAACESPFGKPRDALITTW